MEKHITERIAKIETEINREIDIDEYNQAQTETIDQAGTIGQYHFWVDLGGFCQGDATEDDIEQDCKLLWVSDEDELYSRLNDIYIEELKKIVAEDKKENFKVRNIYDREGHTEQTIMEESEIIEAVEKWLKKNDFSYAIIEEGIFREGQTFGNHVTVQIDTRDGEIRTVTQRQSETSADAPFWIDLASQQEIDFEDTECCDGDKMEAEVSKEKLLSIVDHYDIETMIEDEEIEKIGNKYKVCWWDIYSTYMISAEDFVTKIMDQDWSEWVSNYETWLMDGANFEWEYEVAEYYQELRNERNQSEY